MKSQELRKLVIQELLARDEDTFDKALGYYADARLDLYFGPGVGDRSFEENVAKLCEMWELLEVHQLWVNTWSDCVYFQEPEWEYEVDGELCYEDHLDWVWYAGMDLKKLLFREVAEYM